MRRALVTAALVLAAGCGGGEDAAPRAMAPALGPAAAEPRAAAGTAGRAVVEGRRRLGLGGEPHGGVLAPGGRRAAVSVGDRGVLQLVRLGPLRDDRRVETGTLTWTPFLAWPRPDRLLALSGGDGMSSSVLVDVDPGRGETRSLHALEGAALAAHGSRLGLVAVLAAPARLGAAQLLHVGPDGRRRAFRLPRIPAGAEVVDEATWRMVRRTPGVAVSEADARAFVVAPTGPLRIAEVDLRTGRTALHEVSDGPRLPFGLSAAEAKALDAATATAHWLGDGRLAVARGVEEELGPVRPGGLRIVDVRTWRARVVDPDAAGLRAAGGRLLVTGRVPGVRAYGLDGRLLWRWRSPRPVGLWTAPDGSAGADDWSRGLVVPLDAAGRPGRPVPRDRARGALTQPR